MESLPTQSPSGKQLERELYTKKYPGEIAEQFRNRLMDERGASQNSASIKYKCNHTGVENLPAVSASSFDYEIPFPRHNFPHEARRDQEPYGQHLR